MPRANQILRNGRKAVGDLNLLIVLRSEISHELSNSFQDEQSGSLGDFVMDWNSSQSQDVVLRRKGESGEEVAVSALLSQGSHYMEGIFPREALMKFHCGVFKKGAHRSDFNIHGAYHLQSMTIPSYSVYRGPSFSTLDPQVQDELKKCLVSRGIGEDLTNFLVLTLHKKEEARYLDWLRKLKSFVEKDE